MPRTGNKSQSETRSGRETRSKLRGQRLAHHSVEPAASAINATVEDGSPRATSGEYRQDDALGASVGKGERRTTRDNVYSGKPAIDEFGTVVAEYNMYVNNPGKRLLLLQYPNRDPGQHYCDKTCSKPLALRIKPKCGLVEVDVPIATHSFFDKKKGIVYGEALRRSRVLQDGGSYGLAGGLKAGAGGGMRMQPPNIDQTSRIEEPSREALLDDFENANSNGHVMNKLTLGGQIVPWKDGDPIYMIGVFRGNNVFLSKLDAMVQLRPQFTHLDALADQDKPAFTNKSRSGVENHTGESEARAVNLTVKSSEGDDFDVWGDVSETAKLLKVMREEQWQHLSWVDSEDETSYKVFNDEMFIQDPAGALPLVSTMTDEQWLDAISCPRIDPINQGKKIFTMPESDSESSNSDSSDNDNLIEKPGDTDEGEEMQGVE